MPKSRKRPRTRTDEAAAYREAGHAVAAWDKQIMLMPISIFRNGPGAGKNVWNQALRNVDFAWVRTADSHRLVERLAAVVLAGPVAQRAFAGRSSPWGSVCRKRIGEVRELLNATAGAESGRDNRFADIQICVQKFLARREVHRAVVALGRSLLDAGTLPGDEAVRIIKQNLRPRRSPRSAMPI